MKTEKYLRRDTEQGSLTTTPPGDGLAPDPRQTFCMCFSRGKPVSRSQQKESWGVIRKEGVQVGSWRPRVKSYKESSVSNTQRYKGSNNRHRRIRKSCSFTHDSDTWVSLLFTFNIILIAGQMSGYVFCR